MQKKFRPIRFLICMLVIFDLGSWGCSGPEPVQVCQPDEQQACTCAGQQGKSGTQHCETNGQWGNCSCLSVKHSDASTTEEPPPPESPQDDKLQQDTSSNIPDLNPPDSLAEEASPTPDIAEFATQDAGPVEQTQPEKQEGPEAQPQETIGLERSQGPESGPEPSGPERILPEPTPLEPAPEKAPPEPGPTGPLRIYLATNGNDTRTGLTASSAIKTLQRAHDLLAQMKPQRDVEVRIAPGNYYRQTVVWTYTMPKNTITFMPEKNDKVRPVFDGCASSSNKTCPGGTWLTLKHSKGERTNLRFEYIQVQRYQTAISFNGSRNKASTSNSHNRIYGCFFKDIGNVFNSSLKPSTAAVRLVNSDDNEIANSHFVNVVNTSSGGLIHAIYVAHMSDRNQILRNRFKTSTGDPIRIRDFSNYNNIQENRFTKVATSAAYTEWYCNHDKRTDCTKPTAECPSWENQFRNNTLDGDYTCKTLSTWKILIPENAKGCSAVKVGAKRLYTSGNKPTGKPCSL
ncbi:MAG: hypothetical protein EP343_17780 [Deltaproteobacteria bacterium]|nr:MAG: hypothetical protein EP343_17780 [Deltaproteobacteria bacterium]